MFRLSPALLALLLTGCSGCSSRPVVAEIDLDAPGAFRDRTPDSGVQHTYRNGEESDHLTMLETLGGGIALFDYDGDGKLDIFLTGGGVIKKPAITGLPHKLYRNLGGWKFEDVTDKVGLGGIPPMYTHGVAACDYDRDGFPDLLVTGYGRNILYHNESDGAGGRKFVDVTEKAGLKTPHFWGTSAAFGDLDGDGFPDLYICQYVNWSWQNHPACKGYASTIPRDVCTPKIFDPTPHLLYRNNGNGTFTDVSVSSGLRQPPKDKELGKGLGVFFADLDGDGKPEIYVANDTVDNFLYLNHSKPGQIVLEEKGGRLGVAKDIGGTANGSMGVDAADYDGNGLPSIFVANYENEFHALYRQQRINGRQIFTFYTPPSGLGSIGSNYVGFGTAFLDYDLDGWEDLVIGNGHVVRYPPRQNLQQQTILFRNYFRDGERRFENATATGGPYFQRAHRARGLAVGDLDNDGRPDLVISMVNESVRLLQNEAGPEKHWLGVELKGRDRRDFVGARLTLEAGGRKIVRLAKGGGSYLSSGDRRILFGLGEQTTIGKLTIDWPSGEPKQTTHELAIDRYHAVEQK